MDNVEVFNRLEEICPVKLVDEVNLDELISDCNVAFKIIGYEPENLVESAEWVYLNMDNKILSHFVYSVWRCDYGF